MKDDLYDPDCDTFLNELRRDSPPNHCIICDEWFPKTRVRRNLCGHPDCLSTFNVINGIDRRLNRKKAA